MNDDIATFLDAPRRKGRTPIFPPEVAKARVVERNRRNGRAQTKAYQALARAFPDEYQALFREAQRRINEERGRLPGDPE